MSAGEREREVVYRYHDATKHHVHRFARSLGYLDWANQPDPFRRYHGAPLHPLPLTREDTSPPYEQLVAATQPEPVPISLESVGALFEHSLAISAWKELQGSRWALRCNPSSGNLHPTEGYLIAGGIEGLYDRAAVYHYTPDEHALERRRDIAPAVWERSGIGGASTFAVALTSIHWREAWKYGERAFRYCQHDVGHALGALAFAAAALGWHARLIDDCGTSDLESLLGVTAPGFHPREMESAECLVVIGTDAASAAFQHGMATEQPCLGEPNTLSREHVHWKIIEEVAHATRKAPTTSAPPSLPPPLWCAGHATGLSAWHIATQRRSAVAMDGETTVSGDAFFTMLARTIPTSAAPWPMWPYEPRVHLAVFVHRVEALAPGLYMLVRGTGLDSVRKSCRAGFEWSRVPEAPGDLPLYRLQSGDFRRIATQVSCMQDIAGDGAFSLGMIAEFDCAIDARGAWYYPRLYWECGLIGQVLYLEAEAAGVRATGIGCFFDDAMHEVLGIGDHAYQSLYHFTVGGPIEDTRLMTLPPYNDERRSQVRWAR